MGSFAQKQPRQFSSYTPDVDQEVYSQALASKDQEYKLGEQKVEQYNSVAGHIPVSNPADQKYVQGVADNITSKLNERIGKNGGDFSDQRLLNDLGQMSSSIAKDPKIQDIIASTSNYHHEISRATASEKSTKGKDIANQWHFQKQVQPWLSTDIAATPFSAKFLEFTDIEKGIDDIAKSVPEEEVVTNNMGLNDNSKADIISQSFKFRSADKIRKAAEGYLTTNPGATTQSYVEAEYKYKDSDDIDLYNEKHQISMKTLDHYQLQANELQQQLLGLGDVKNPKVNAKRQAITQQIEGIKKEYEEKALDLSKQDMIDIAEADKDPNKKSTLLTSLYNERLIQQKIDQYAYNDEGKITISGTSGFQKQREINAERIAEQKENREASQFRLSLEDRQQARIDKALAKQQGISNQYGPVLAPIPTKNANDSWSQVHQTIEQTDKKIQSAELGIAYSVLQRAGGFSGLKQDRNGNITFTKQFTTGNVPGKGLRTMPTVTYIYGGDYVNDKGVTESYNGVIPDLIKAYKDGTYHSENTYTLSDIDRKSIADLSDMVDDQSMKKQLVDGLETEIKNETGTTNLINHLNSHPIIVNPLNSNFVNPFSRHSAENDVSKPTPVTGNDVINYNSLSDNEVTALLNYNSTELPQEEQKVLNKHNLDYDKFIAIRSSSDPALLSLIQKHGDVSTKLNKAVEDLNLISTPGFADWTGVKSDTEDPTQTTAYREDKIKNYAIMLQSDPNVKSVGDKLLSLLTRKENDKDPNFTYTQDAITKNFKLFVERNGTTVPVDISAEQGKNWGFSSLLGKQTQVEERLAWSKNHSTCPEGKIPNFTNAKSLGVISDEVGEKDLRYHIIPEHTAQGLINVLYFYSKNTKTGVEDPVQTSTIEDIHSLGMELEAKKQQLLEADKQAKK